MGPLSARQRRWVLCQTAARSTADVLPALRVLHFLVQLRPNIVGQYLVEATSRGHVGRVRMCRLTNGEGRAFFETADGWVLDVRQKFVGTRQDVGCE